MTPFLFLFYVLTDVQSAAQHLGLTWPADSTLTYAYKVPWTRVDQTAVNSILAAKQQTLKASPADKDAIKTDIADKLYTSYKTFRTDNPSVTQKVPGRKVYKDVARQVRYSLLISSLRRVT